MNEKYIIDLGEHQDELWRWLYGGGIVNEMPDWADPKSRPENREELEDLLFEAARLFAKDLTPGHNMRVFLEAHGVRCVSDKIHKIGIRALLRGSKHIARMEYE